MFYDNQNGALKVPRNALSAGQFVALLDGKNWRRVEIICISEGDVLVHAIDWGWKRYVKIADLSYLTEEFAISTRKACKGCLHGVKPIEALWNPSAIMAFMTKTKGQKILATVKAAADNTFELSLTYNAMLNSTVEDYLLERKLAKVSDEIKPTMNGVLVKLLIFNFLYFELIPNFLNSRSTRVPIAQHRQHQHKSKSSISCFLFYF